MGSKIIAFCFYSTASFFHFWYCRGETFITTYCACSSRTFVEAGFKASYRHSVIIVQQPARIFKAANKCSFLYYCFRVKVTNYATYYFYVSAYKCSFIGVYLQKAKVNNSPLSNK